MSTTRDLTPNLNYQHAWGRAIQFLESRGWRFTVGLPGKMLQFEHETRLQVLQIWFYPKGTSYFLANFNNRNIVEVRA